MLLLWQARAFRSRLPKLKKLKKAQTSNSATADQKTAPKPSLDRPSACSARRIDILEPSPEHGEEKVDLPEPSPKHGEEDIDLRSTSGSAETTKRVTYLSVMPSMVGAAPQQLVSKVELLTSTEVMEFALYLDLLPPITSLVKLRSRRF